MERRMQMPASLGLRVSRLSATVLAPELAPEAPGVVLGEVSIFNTTSQDISHSTVAVECLVVVKLYLGNAPAFRL